MSAHIDRAAAVTVAATADDEVPVHTAVVASPHNSVVIGSVVDQTFLAAAAGVVEIQHPVAQDWRDDLLLSVGKMSNQTLALCSTTRPELQSLTVFHETLTSDTLDSMR